MEKEKEENGTGYFLMAIPSVRSAITWAKDAPPEAGGGFQAAYTLFQALCEYAETGELPQFAAGEWLIQMLFDLQREIVEATRMEMDV